MSAVEQVLVFMWVAACLAAIGLLTIVALLMLARRRSSSAARSPARTPAAPTAPAIPARPDRVGPFDPSRPVPAIVSIDVETTGTDPFTARVIEIAFVTSDGPELVSFVNPGIHIPKASSDVHGITDRDVKGAPTFVEVWDRARALGLLARFPMAYHAPYEQRVIGAELARAGRKDESHLMHTIEWIDPCVAVRLSDSGSARLAEACLRRGIRVGRVHRALDDARAALMLWNTLEREVPRFTREPLAIAVGWQIAARDVAEEIRAARRDA